ncbi:MAG TPA: helix-turn-helix transcriptional regulator [Vicinamibacterales bacterium]|jgi:DNA-binding PadR family transcriptional regulator
MVTLPPKERLILDLLIEQPDFGLRLVQRSTGRLKRGTVYVTLARMQRKGFVRSETETPMPGAIGLPRRIYFATPLGERARRAWSQLSAALAWVE